MLLGLNVKNFILIDNLDLDFNSGLVVITGESGAGKSILLDTVLFVLGAKSSGNIIKTGADYCSVSLTFLSSPSINSYLQDISLELSEEIVVKSTLSSQGRRKFYINEQVVTQKAVARLAPYFLELYGQNSQAALMSGAAHRDILDQFSEASLLVDKVQNLYQTWQKIEQEVASLASQKANIEKEIEYLQHICEELVNANIKVEEEEELSEIKQQLQGREKQINLIQSILTDIEDSNINQVISRVQRNISRTPTSLPEEVNSSFDQIYDQIEKIKLILQNELKKLEHPSYSLEEVDDRLHQIRDLARKHSCRVEDLPDFLSKSKLSLEQLQSLLINNTDLQKQVIIAKESFYQAAEELSLLRKVNAKLLEDKTMSELAKLEMKNTRFKIDIVASNTHSGLRGIDNVRFIVSTNPGTPMLPIDQVGSGGELSRFMLAFRVALFDRVAKNTIIFDEIDAGIGGATADSIGQRLKNLSKAAQVIVITHQPQVASKADQHLLVYKTHFADTTKIEVKVLNLKEKSEEIARMISGQKITEAGLQAAKELLSG